jgi:hypothetical protein
MLNVQPSTMAAPDKPQLPKTEDRVGLVDVVAHDAKTDELVLVMNESGGWDGSDAQLHQLQERFNAYVSFLLDGELAEAHPDLVKKRARIELRCDQMPDGRTLDLLAMIHDRLAFQEIKMEVVVRGDDGQSVGRDTIESTK